MRRPTTLLIALVALLAAGLDDAEPTSYLFEDVAGDANAINGQGFAQEDPVQTGPAQYAPADLLGLRMATTYDTEELPDGTVVHTPTGFQARIAVTELPSDVGPRMIYRVVTNIAGCSSFLQYDTDASTATWRMLDPGCGFEDDGTGLTSVTLTAPSWGIELNEEHSEIVLNFALEGADDRAAALMQDGAFFTFDEVHVRTYLVTVTAPVVDEMPNRMGFWEYGSDVPEDEPAADPGTEPTDSA